MSLAVRMTRSDAAHTRLKANAVELSNANTERIREEVQKDSDGLEHRQDG